MNGSPGFILTLRTKNVCTMAHGQLLVLSHDITNSLCRRLIWYQSACWDLRSIYGYRRDLWADGGHYR